MTHTYLGSSLTDRAHRGRACDVVRRGGRVVRGRNGNVLVRWSDGSLCVVFGRYLRRNETQATLDL